MRIFSKKTFQFDHPAGQEPAVVVQAHGFVDVPDWVEKSTMFKLASDAGELEVIGSKQDEKAAESGSRGKTKAEKEAEAKAKASEVEAERLKAEKDAEEAAAKAAELEAANNQ